MTGEAGYMTRIEAFVDLLRKRRREEKLLKTSYYLGIDVGSVSTNLVVINENDEIVEKIVLKNKRTAYKCTKKWYEDTVPKAWQGRENKRCGNYRKRQAACKRNVGADIVKNEITTHAIAAQKLVPEVRTIIEIGGRIQR